VWGLPPFGLAGLAAAAEVGSGGEKAAGADPTVCWTDFVPVGADQEAMGLRLRPEHVDV